MGSQRRRRSRQRARSKKQLSQVEDSYLIAPRLSEMASILEVDEDDMGAAHIKADGTVKIKKTTKAEVPLPANTEQLRYRIKLQGHLWDMIRLHLPTRPLLANLTLASWRDHV